MDSVFRALAVYGFLLLVFRITGKRSLAQITTFDAVLLLIISEAVQQALIDSDESMINAAILVVTLLSLDVAMSLISVRSRNADKWLNDAPVLIVEDGKPLRDRMIKERIGEDDVMEQARELRGLERMDQIKYAILERSGHITVVPKETVYTR